MEIGPLEGFSLAFAFWLTSTRKKELRIVSFVCSLLRRMR